MEINLPVPAQQACVRLGVFLRRQGLSVTLVRRLKFSPQGLLVNGLRARTNQPLCEGDRVTLTLPDEPEPSATPQDIALDILYETPHAMVVNKPAGMVIHPTGVYHSDTLANAFCGLMQKRGTPVPFRAVGRLDADTSGLVLLAMNVFAAPALAGQMQKTYLALAGGRMEGAGSIDAPLASCPGSAILQRVDDVAGKPSITAYRVLAPGEACSLVEVQPQTGRTHQIRAHFAHIGHPLLGDALYGGDQTTLHRHALHCAALRFTEPMGEEVEVHCPLPWDLWEAAGQKMTKYLQ